MAGGAPCESVVVSSRTRLARNVIGYPFSPHAGVSANMEVREELRRVFAGSGHFSTYHELEMSELSGRERGFLKEARFISKEMERGGPSRAVYLDRELKCSIMVNEEDHLRIQCLEPGLQVAAAMERVRRVEGKLGALLSFAHHRRFGFLTACPTNAGTGLRASVMMHLPALSLRREIETIISALPRQGMTVRGFHGENSDNLGDLFQISNEVTLGRSVEQIEELLAEVVGMLLDREIEARSLLFTKGGVALQDTVWRSFGLLTHARKMDTAEAMKLLSRLRLGIDQQWFPGLDHAVLNALIAEVQPGHLMIRHDAPDETDTRGVLRADLIRKTLLAT
jgi:protein arginine kinase